MYRIFLILVMIMLMSYASFYRVCQREQGLAHAFSIQRIDKSIAMRIWLQHNKASGGCACSALWWHWKRRTVTLSASQRAQANKVSPQYISQTFLLTTSRQKISSYSWNAPISVTVTSTGVFYPLAGAVFFCPLPAPSLAKGSRE
jgi:hypothetical protein